jgi:uncharacterized protein
MLTGYQDVGDRWMASMLKEDNSDCKPIFNLTHMEAIINDFFNAARTGDVTFLQENISKINDLNVRDSRGYTPLIIATYNGQLEAAAVLLEAGADVNASDFGGNTSLMGVSFKGYPEIATLLIGYGADLNLQHGNGGTALMFASMFGRNNMVKLLLDFGADINIRENRGMTAADLAAQQGNMEAVEMLEAADMIR